jgi:lysophospholipase L1-like esterase
MMKTPFYHYLLIIILIMMGVSCQNPEPDTDEITPLTYLALGDSYTIGTGVDPESRFPNQLQKQLHDKGLRMKEPRIIARTGWTTDELSDAIEKADFDSAFHLVSLLIGVNNQYQGRDPENYGPAFEALLRKAIDLAAGNAGRVVVLSIPDWGVTPFAQGRDREKIATEIDDFNARNKQIAGLYGVSYIDVTAISRMASVNPGLLSGDSLHPSAYMYGLWVDAMLPEVIHIIENQ